ncbi:MAG: hypothetical protein ABI233_08150 [Chthoniobacterales bacterium]
MSFISTGFRELTLKVRRQKTRMALHREKSVLQKAEITLGREGTNEAANFPEMRAEIVALRKLEQEQREFTLRSAKIEEALKQIDAQRQENSRAQTAAIAKLEEEKRPFVERRDAAKAEAEKCGKELAAADRRLRENERADEELLKKLSALQETEPPSNDLDAQMQKLGAERANLPNERAKLSEARAASAESCKAAREKLTAADGELAQVERNIAKVRGEYEARDRALNESSRDQQEEAREVRQQHQTVEEKKNPAYLNIGRHLANAGIGPPTAPHLLVDVQRHREAVARLAAHTHALGEVSGRIDKQELRRFYFVVASIIVLAAIVVPLALQSPAKRDWLPQDTATLFSVDPMALSKSAAAQRWQKSQPQVWRKVFTGLLGPATRTPSVNLATDVSRVMRALVIENSGQAREYDLVEISGEIGPVLRAITQDESFDQSTVSGLVVWNRPNVSVARIGPTTLAVGSLGEVDHLVQVRLGTEPDLKVDDPLPQEFKVLESDNAIRLASRVPTDLPRLFGPVFVPELLDAAQLLGFSIVLDQPFKAHLFVRATDAAAAKKLAAAVKADVAHWLTLPGSDYILAADSPKIDQSGTDVDLSFDVPDGAAQLLLTRLARVQPEPVATPAPAPTPAP